MQMLTLKRMTESYFIGLNCDMEKLERAEFIICVEAVLTGIWYSEKTLQEKLECFNTLVNTGFVTTEKLRKCEVILTNYSREERTTNVERSFLTYIRLTLGGTIR